MTKRKHRYELVVGNVGSFQLGDAADPHEIYRDYVHLSKHGGPNSPVTGEPVTLLRDGEPVKEYDPVEAFNARHRRVYSVVESTPGYMRDSAPVYFWTAREAYAHARELARSLRDEGYAVTEPVPYGELGYNEPPREGRNQEVEGGSGHQPQLADR